MIDNMKTIAITIDEHTLGLLDRLTSKADRTRSRSALVRAAVREFVARHQRSTEEARERVLLHKHRDLLRKEARALIQGQAEP
jgi:metal-responsive CopG/Arc/MetJ family transcriptional regulator